jgi:hypothetical protein
LKAASIGLSVFRSSFSPASISMQFSFERLPMK